MVAQYSGITLGLSIAGAVFINYAMLDLRSLLPAFSDEQLNAIISGMCPLCLVAGTLFV